MMKFNLKKVIPLLALTAMLFSSCATNVFAAGLNASTQSVEQLNKDLWGRRRDSLNTNNLDQILQQVDSSESSSYANVCKVEQILKRLYQGYYVGYADDKEKKAIVLALGKFNIKYPNTEIKNILAKAKKVKAPDELSILQNNIDKQVQDILSMFQEDGVSESVDTVSFTDFCEKKSTLNSSISKSIGFFTKLFRRPSFEKDLLKKISSLNNDVLKHASKTSGNVTFVSKAKLNELEVLLASYLKMKSAKDEKSKLACAKKILSFPLRSLFGQTIKTNSYGGWALDRCIRLTMICLFVGTLVGSYNWWCATEYGFAGGFLLPFKIVKNVSTMSYSVLSFLASKITQPYGELTWDEEYVRQLGSWLWGFIGS